MKSKKYYIIGIGGVAMASLAGLLKQKGHEVAGSDQEMYEPMKGMLKSLKVKVLSPYNSFHVKRYKPDVIVVGNAIKKDNPELDYLFSIGQSYRTMPDVLMNEIIKDKKTIVVTGTHGKTTTAALIAWILEYAGLDPTVFVGGLLQASSRSFKLGKGPYAVIEGDEYRTLSVSHETPKFFHYRPYIGLINNIEYEHIDMYKSMSEL